MWSKKFFKSIAWSCFYYHKENVPTTNLDPSDQWVKYLKIHIDKNQITINRNYSHINTKLAESYSSVYFISIIIYYSQSKILNSTMCSELFQILLGLSISCNKNPNLKFTQVLVDFQHVQGEVWKIVVKYLFCAWCKIFLNIIGQPTLN